MVVNLGARLALVRRLEKPHDYGLFLRILVFALVAPWLMRLPLAQVAKLLTPAPSRLHPPRRPVAQIIAYTDAILHSCRPLVQDRCLTRGLTLYYFLGRNGFAVELHFGVGYANGRFAGHCWLVKEGKPFAEAGDPYVRFTPTYQFPIAPARSYAINKTG